MTGMMPTGLGDDALELAAWQHEPRDPATGEWISLESHDYPGTPGSLRHITRTEQGQIPLAAIADLKGREGEMPGEHRNRQGPAWDAFKADIAANGIRNPVFITVDPGMEPQISEGSHRRDAAAELGMTHVPAEVRYFGHSEERGTVTERAFTSTWYHGVPSGREARQIARSGLKSGLSARHVNNTLTVRADEAGYHAGRHGAVIEFRIPKSKQAEYLTVTPEQAAESDEPDWFFGAPRISGIKRFLPPEWVHKVTYMDPHHTTETSNATCPHCGCPADGIAIQLAGWHDAWKHELRDPHTGEWVRSAVSTQVIPGASYSKQQLMSKLVQMFNSAPAKGDQPAVQNFRRISLGRAVTALKADDWREAVHQLEEAAYAAEGALAGTAAKHGRSKAASSYRLLGQAIEERYTEATSLGDRMAAVNRAAAQEAPHWLGGGQEKWNGDVTIFDQNTDPSVAASMGWHGEFSMSDASARVVRDVLDATGPSEPGPDLAVSLHELIHGVEAPLPHAHTTSGRTPRDDEIIRLADLVARIEKTSGRRGSASLAGINFYRDKSTPEVTQADIDDLISRGFLRSTGRDSKGDEAWGTTYAAMSTNPPEEGADMVLHREAYKRYLVSRAEEGFTELGTDYHMPEWLETVGIAGHPTTTVDVVDPGAVERKFSKQAAYDNQQRFQELEREAGDLPGKPGTMEGYTALGTAKYAFWGDPMDPEVITAELAKAASAYENTYPEMRSKIINFMHQLGVDPSDVRNVTMREWAEQIRDHPSRIQSNSAWGHYGWETRAAQAWVKAIARYEGLDPDYPGGPGVARSIELSDEINREGPAGKFPAMARQIMRMMGVPADARASRARTLQQQLEGTIESMWPKDAVDDPAATMIAAQQEVKFWQEAQT